MACADLPKGRTAASREPLYASLVALGEGALIPEFGPVREAGFGNLLKKFKQIVLSVRRAPKLWDRIKDFLGVQGVDELPGRLKELAKEGYRWLRKALDAAFSTWPLKLYTLPEAKLVSFNALLERTIKLSPKFESFLKDKVKPKIDQFDTWLKKNLPHLSKVLMVSIYIWIWLNVTEFEWDLKSILDATTGALQLSDLLASLPGSAFGFLMNAFGFGTFSLLPATIAVRLLVLMAARYVEWDGGFRLNREKLSEDFGIPVESIA